MLLHLQGFYLHQENRLFFYNDFGVGCKKVFVVKAYISDDTKSVCYNAKFIGIAEMSVHIHLLNGRICGSMRRHGAIGCFVRVVGIIQSFCLFKCFELLYDTVGIFGLFSVTHASMPDVSKSSMEAFWLSIFWHIGSVSSTI